MKGTPINWWWDWDRPRTNTTCQLVADFLEQICFTGEAVLALNETQFCAFPEQVLDGHFSFPIQ